jgi:hypothetical protein
MATMVEQPYPYWAKKKKQKKKKQKKKKQKKKRRTELFSKALCL